MDNQPLAPEGDQRKHLIPFLKISLSLQLLNLPFHWVCAEVMRVYVLARLLACVCICLWRPEDNFRGLRQFEQE